MALNKAYATTGKIFEQVSIRNNPAMYEQLRAIEPREIIIVRGDHDHIEKLMDTIKVPYTFLEPEDISKHNGGRVMMVNCRMYDSVPQKKFVEELVREGGRLVTTDWALSFANKVFPKRLSFVRKTSDDVVEIQCHNDIARRLVGLNYAQCHPKWWLEGSSDVYDIKQGVIPIITSAEMKEKYGYPYIAAGFKEGKGEALHFISHLELQRTNLRTKLDTEGLDEFLEKMQATKTPDMEDAKVAELEAAYSTLNTLAYLCLRTPILETSMNSIIPGKNTKTVAKSKGLA